MATYKNIRIPKRGGGSRLQRVQVLASGKYKFVKNLNKKNKKSSPKTKKNKTKKNKRNVNKTAKKNKKKASKVIHIPLALIGGVGGAFSTQAPSGNTLIGRALNGDIEGFIYDAREIFTGVDANGNFNKDFLMKGWKPIIIGTVAHILASKLGINRALYQAQNGLPIKVGL